MFGPKKKDKIERDTTVRKREKKENKNCQQSKDMETDDLDLWRASLSLFQLLARLL